MLESGGSPPPGHPLRGCFAPTHPHFGNLIPRTPTTCLQPSETQWPFIAPIFFKLVSSISANPPIPGKEAGGSPPTAQRSCARARGNAPGEHARPQAGQWRRRRHKGGRSPPKGGVPPPRMAAGHFFFNKPRGRGGFFKKIVKLTRSCVRKFRIQESPCFCSTQLNIPESQE